MTATDRAAPPRSLLGAAVVVGLEALAAVVAGVALLVGALAGHPNDRGSAVVGALVAIVLGAGIGVLAVGLVRCRAWARTPTFLAQFFAGVLVVNQISTLPALSVPLGVAVVAVVVLLLTPAARAALSR